MSTTTQIITKMIAEYLAISKNRIKENSYGVYPVGSL